MANENDEITGVASSEAKELEQTRRQLETDQGHPRADPEPVLAPGLSDELYTPPEPEEAPAAAPPPEQQQEQQRGVPPAALAEERERRRQSESELASLRENQARMSERFQMLQTTIQDAQTERLQQAQQGQIPDPDEDLTGFVKAKSAEYERQMGQLQQRNQQLQQQGEYERQVQDVTTRARADAQSFAAQQPDFEQAYQWVRQQQIAELTAQGIEPGLAGQELDRRELNMIAHHQQAGRSPAQAAYAAAQARGWQAPAQGVPPAPNGQGQPNGAYTQQPVTASPQYVTAQQQAQRPDLTNMQSGMLESRSLDQAAGTGQGLPETLEAMANMSDAEFAERAGQVRTMMRRSMR